MKKIILSLFVLIVFCVIGTVVYVMNTDWISQHKDKITEQFYNATGKVMRFDGNVTFRFLPTPYLRANDVKIYNSEDATDTPLAEIRSLDVEVALKPLLKGEFDVTDMEMTGVKFNIDWDKGFSWQSDLSADQRQIAENSRLSLNVARVNDAELFFKSDENHLNFHLTNLNGEISAESMFGPFRIEGNYINGGAPEGFALTIGRLSDISPTSVSLAVTHPASNSYFRFDGSFRTSDKIINGNVIVETQNLSKFAYANLPSLKISEEFNQKAALGFDITLNPQNAALSNMVIKYGDTTSGSGNLQIPFDDEQNKKIRAVFNFTDFDLNVFSGLLEETAQQAKEQNKLPNWNVSGEMKALRVHYLEQQLKNWALNFELEGEKLLVKNSSIVLPGNTTVDIDGELFSADDKLFYKADVAANTDNLIQTLKWLKLELPQPSPSVYKNMALNAKISGTVDRMQLSPFKLVLDKTTVNGEAGIVFEGKKDIMLTAQADTINFDNYISALPEEEKNKSWLERVEYRFGKLSTLNDIDLVLDVKSDLIIYENMPFEKIAVKGNVLNKVAELDYLTIEKVANTKVNLSGKISGFGVKPQVEGFKYDIKSADVNSLINKLELKAPGLDYKRFNTLSWKGTVNGDVDQFDINTDVELGNLSLNYEGGVIIGDSITDFDGKLKLKHPNFNQMLSNLQSKYQPQGVNLGGLQMQADIKGNVNHFDISSLDVNIGQSNAVGNLFYELVGDRPNILTKLKINKLDAEKFLQKRMAQTQENISNDDNVDFLGKPLMSKDNFDFSFYNKFDGRAELELGELYINDMSFKDVHCNLEMAQNQLMVRDFEGLYNNTPYRSELTLSMEAEPTLNWSGSISDAGSNNFNLGGKIYQLKEGSFSALWNITSSARSRSEFWQNISGHAEFKSHDNLIKGFNIQAIYADLLKRETHDGLSEVVREALRKGSSQFKDIKWQINIDKGKFTLSDAKMQADNLDISVYGEGNLSEWTMNLVFNAKFAEPQYLPEFSFILKDSITNPYVDVNVSSLFKFYKAKIDQKEAEAEKAIRIVKTQREDASLEQKRITDNLVSDARNVLEKDIDAKIETAFSEKSKERYVAQKQEIAGILASLVEQMAAFDVNNLSDDDLVKMDSINKDTKREILRLTDTVADIYFSDIKMKAAELDNQQTDLHNQLKKSSFNYNAALQKFNDRLEGITTVYTLADDLEFQRQKEEISAQINSLEKLNQQSGNLKTMLASDNVEAYEKYNTELDKNIALMKNEQEKLQKLIEEFEAKENTKLDSVIAIYHNEVEEKENERLLKENTGSISVKKTGQTVKISRDLEEIKNANEAIINEEVKVLDFTKPKVQNDNAAKTNVGVVKKGSNLIAK